MTAPASANLPDVIRLDRPVLLVGRAAAAEVRLPHPAVSRWHAELRPGGGAVVVRDLGSRGGVFVNGAAVTTARLAEDDVVAFGPVAYEVKGGHLRRVRDAHGARVEARDLSVRRGDRTVLAAVNLSIPPNNFVGILGPSGGGKTTLLKALTGYLPAATGKVFLDGLDLTTHREAVRAMAGFVPQEDVVYGTLTARENLDFALRLRVAGDLRAAERAAWVEQTLRRLGLEDHADRPVRTLSGGQRKRVSVGVELLSRPRLLVLDEPTAGLDPAAEARLMRFLAELAARGTTVVCTTHVLESLEAFGVVMVVAGGRLLGSGSPANLLSHFQAGTYAELYEKLENLSPPPAAPGALPSPVPAPAAPARTTHSRPGNLSQVAAQFRRGLLLTARDRALLALLAGQPLFIGLLIGLSQWAPGPSRGLDLLYTFAVLASVWLGLNNTAREVVRDRAVYARERRSAVNPESYLLAKVGLFAALGLAQVALLVLWLRYLNFVDPATHPSAARELAAMPLGRVVLVLWATYLSAMFLGLLVSALAPTEEVAVAVLPLVVLPQLLLSAVASNLYWEKGGFFAPLPVLLENASEGGRGAAGWALEVASLFTYSRPALAFFLNFEDRPSERAAGLVEVVNWAHLLALLLASATAFVAVFLARERRWLEES
jgi:heme ABC exporter ATP-binding subunit CcmA